MNEQAIILTTPKELEQLIEKVVSNVFKREKTKTDEHKYYSINQVSKILHRKHSTIKELVLAGAIASTCDGKISEKSLKEYLKAENEN